MHADVDKGAEVGHVAHHAFQNHAQLQIFDFVHAFGEGGGLKLTARVAAGFFQFGEDV